MEQGGEVRATPAPASPSTTAPDLNIGGEPLPAIEQRGLVTSSPGRLIGILVCLVVLTLVAMLSIVVGTRTMAIDAVWNAFANFDPTNNDHIVVQSLRVPRTLLGIEVGLALGLAGAVIQGVVRNPLADPGILGVSAGASLSVVLAIYFLGISSLIGYVWFGFAGAALAAVLVYAVGSIGAGGATPVKLTLAGAAMSAFFASIATAIMLVDLSTLDQFRFWVVGSLSGRDMSVVVQVAPFILIGAVMALASGRLLNALALGDDLARSLGQKVGRSRMFAALAVVLLVGGATAAAGPIAFIGLIVPHVARAFTGPDYRWVLPYSAVLAAILLLGCDVLGRVIARPGEVQASVVAALIGVPFFIALVRRRKLAEL